MSDTEQNYPVDRKCDQCGGEMKLIGRLPRRLHHSSHSVFRCGSCDNVVQERE